MLTEYDGELYAGGTFTGGLMNWGCWPVRLVGDLDGDGDIDADDFAQFQRCRADNIEAVNPECKRTLYSAFSRVTAEPEYYWIATVLPEIALSFSASASMTASRLCCGVLMVGVSFFSMQPRK